MLNQKITLSLEHEYNNLEKSNNRAVETNSRLEGQTEELRIRSIEAVSKNKQSSRDMKMNLKSIKEDIHELNLKHKQSKPLTQGYSAIDEEQGEN